MYFLSSFDLWKQIINIYQYEAEVSINTHNGETDFDLCIGNEEIDITDLTLNYIIDIDWINMKYK